MFQCSDENLTVLFRAEISDDPDLYVEELQKLNILAVVIPVMTFQYCHLPQLQEALKEHDSYQGLIFTSTRAVKAIEKACQDLKEGDFLAPWRKKANFAVGEATKKMAELRLNLPTSGEFSGSSKNLGEFISMGCSKGSKQKFLFPCAKNRKDTILQTLQTNGIQIHELVCYESIANKELKNDWEMVIASKKKMPDILVFFSPSGVQFVHSMFHEINCDISKFKISAIGKVTSEELCKIGIEPFAVAAKPTPRDLSLAISNKLQ